MRAGLQAELQAADKEVPEAADMQEQGSEQVQDWAAGMQAGKMLSEVRDQGSVRALQQGSEVQARASRCLLNHPRKGIPVQVLRSAAPGSAVLQKRVLPAVREQMQVRKERA